MIGLRLLFARKLSTVLQKHRHQSLGFSTIDVPPLEPKKFTSNAKVDTARPKVAPPKPPKLKQINHELLVYHNKDVRMFLSVLKNAPKINFESFRKADEDKKNDLQATIVSCMDEKWIVNFGTDGTAHAIQCLGKVGFNFNGNVDHFRVLTDLFIQFTNYKVISPMQLVTALNGLGACGVKLKAFLDDRVQLFYQILEKVVPNFPEPTYISPVLIALQKMGVKWYDMPRSLQKVLLEAVWQHEAKFDLNFGSSAIRALGRLEFFIGAEQREEYDVLNKLAARVLRDIDTNFEGKRDKKGKQKDVDTLSSYISSTLLGLSGMKLTYPYMSEELQQALHRLIEVHMSVVDSQAVSNIILTYGKFGLNWNYLSEDARKIIQIVLGAHVTKMTPIGFQSTILGLATMNADFQTFTPDFQAFFLEHFMKKIEVAPKQEVQGSMIVNSISGLGRMNIRWDALDLVIKQKLDARMVTIIPKLDTSLVIVLVTSLGYLNASLQYQANRPDIVCLSERCRMLLIEAIKKNLSKLTDLAFSQIFFNLGKMNVVWKQLPSSFSKDLESHIAWRFSKMSPEQILHLMAGMDRIKIDYDLLLPATQKAMESALIRASNSTDARTIKNIHHIGTNFTLQGEKANEEANKQEK